MYRQPSPPSPTFDVPELPAPLRRMKPLPKRRRTSDPTPHDRNDEGGLASPAGATTPGQSHDDGSQEHSDLGPGTPDPAQAAKTVLEAYYMPVLGGVPDLFKHTRAHTSAQDSEGEGGDSRTSTPVPIDLSAALAAGLGYGSLGGFGLGSGAGSGCGGGGAGGAGAGEDGQEDEDGESGDYVDHLQQPGNTKKRKVPANMSGSARARRWVGRVGRRGRWRGQGQGSRQGRGCSCGARARCGCRRRRTGRRRAWRRGRGSWDTAAARAGGEEGAAVARNACGTPAQGNAEEPEATARCCHWHALAWGHARTRPGVVSEPRLRAGANSSTPLTAPPGAILAGVESVCAGACSRRGRR